MNFDSEDQERWVRNQYTKLPDKGIFGPVFSATRKALGSIEWPHVPLNKEQANGTERAFAAAFHEAGIEVGAVYDFWDPKRMEKGVDPFRKIFAGRQ